MRNLQRLLRPGFVLAASGVLFCASTPLHADLTLIDMFRNIVYDQTSGATPIAPTSYFLNLEATEANAGDFTSVTVAYPGPGSPDTLTLEPGTFRFGEGPSFSSMTAMDNAYPTGTYTFSASGGTAPAEMAALTYLLDGFTSDIPALTAASYDALQGMNPNAPFTFNFNPFTPNANASFGTTYFSVFNSSFAFSGAPTSTSATMAAGTLLPDTTYEYELDFSDRVTGIDPLNGVPTLIGFDVRTDGFFTTTTTPEPSTMIPLSILFVGAVVWVLRRKSKPAVSVIE
jgi:hypothetical protein